MADLKNVSKVEDQLANLPSKKGGQGSNHPHPKTEPKKNIVLENAFKRIKEIKYLAPKLEFREYKSVNNQVNELVENFDEVQMVSEKSNEVHSKQDQYLNKLSRLESLLQDMLKKQEH